ncbi:unnamed protein product [Protopolystoma xenopodis]|uniref:Uncharacterized protein n=1 Tax=Protopolystoma xenopodis TaxID=117903 RepID=A0A448XIL7_9PLAT|nr:unnamed protein product [Protopolystoma xenopodis]
MCKFNSKHTLAYLYQDVIKEMSLNLPAFPVLYRCQHHAAGRCSNSAEFAIHLVWLLDTFAPPSSATHSGLSDSFSSQLDISSATSFSSSRGSLSANGLPFGTITSAAQCDIAPDGRAHVLPQVLKSSDTGPLGLWRTITAVVGVGECHLPRRSPGLGQKTPGSFSHCRCDSSSPMTEEDEPGAVDWSPRRLREAILPETSNETENRLTSLEIGPVVQRASVNRTFDASSHDSNT